MGGQEPHVVQGNKTIQFSTKKLCASLTKWYLFFAGIIPGPHEPRTHINTYLHPLVDDFMDLWNGMQIDTPDGEETLRAALIAVTADLPALRKITQFLGHKADYGCTRCKFKGEREPGTQGASGRMSYVTTRPAEERKHEEVLAQAVEYQSARSKSDAAARVVFVTQS